MIKGLSLPRCDQVHHIKKHLIYVSCICWINFSGIGTGKIWRVPNKWWSDYIMSFMLNSIPFPVHIQAHPLCPLGSQSPSIRPICCVAIKGTFINKHMLLCIIASNFEHLLHIPSFMYSSNYWQLIWLLCLRQLGQCGLLQLDYKFIKGSIRRMLQKLELVNDKGMSSQRTHRPVSRHCSKYLLSWPYCLEYLTYQDWWWQSKRLQIAQEDREVSLLMVSMSRLCM